MSVAVLTPPPRSAPVQALQPYRWSIDEYRELDKTGLFHDKKTMLLHGEVFVMGLPSGPHDMALNLTQDYLRSIIPAGHHIRNQQGFDIGTDNDPGPDLAVVPGSIRDYPAAPTSAILIVEIANTSLVTDTTTKVELYALAHVPEYWVIDVVNRELQVFRDPVAKPLGRGANAYRNTQTLGENESVSPLFAPTTTVKVSDLLP
jgi:Uma2 family endonuclease